jgi:hypothetical protein
MVTKAPLKLGIELIPISSWENNLRKIIPRRQWDKLRNQVHERNGRQCEICSSSEKLHCHEHWEFEETTKVQKLVGLGTICSMCHHVAHFGRAKQLAAQGHLDINAVVNHFLKVNECDQNTFLNHEKEVLRLFMRRSQHEWQVDFGEYADLVQKKAK